MKRFREFLYWVGFMVLVLPTICTKVAKGQRPPVMKEFRTATATPLDSTLPMLSEYRQPPIYREWWDDIAMCHGLLPPPEALTSKVQFFQVNAAYFTPQGRSRPALALTIGDSAQIYMAAPLIWQQKAVQHEMMHMILHWLGYRMGSFHPPEIFEACGLHIKGFQ